MLLMYQNKTNLIKIEKKKKIYKNKFQVLKKIHNQILLINFIHFLVHAKSPKRLSASLLKLQ